MYELRGMVEYSVLPSLHRYVHVTLSHLRSKESTGIHKPCIPGLIPSPRVHLKIDQRIQRNNFPEIHLNVHHGVHLDVSWENHSFELFDQSFHQKIEVLVEGFVYL